MGTTATVIVITLLSIGALAVLVTAFRSGRLLKCLLTSAIQGIIALFAVNISGLLTGITLPINWYTLGAGALFGVPGTVALLFFNMLFR